ncbi:glycoside hydrolase family 76 protein [Nonomuraea angiospora]|uniref:glycoside hydrolase family 76 protein n=1 Tax=Nonomuraea angiospora TaxID=46172 RepID=UPI003316A7C5
MRARAAAAGLVLTAALALAPAPAHATVPADADAAMSAFVSAFWDPAKKYFYTNSDHQIHAEHAHGPEGGLYTDFWWEAQLWELVMDAYQRTGGAAYRQLIDDVYAGFVAYYPTFANDFNDDLGWWALAYEITRDATYLNRSRALFDQIWAEQDTAFGGGIWWRRSVHTQKNVATNAPAVITATMLYAATGDASYLTDARAAADWATTYLTNGGTMMHEGSDDAGGFKSLLFRSLNTLVTEHGQTQYLPFLQRNATQAWRHRRTGDGLAGPDWSAPAPATYLQSLTAAAAVSALQLVQHDGNTGLQPENGRYEAENALSSGIGAESTQPGFSGRGYLAGWNTSGQTLTFHVNVPSAGAHELRFRYAAAAGDAVRHVFVNGAGAVDALRFPSTGSWSTWNTVTVPNVALQEGANTVSVIFNASKGSANWLNLDELTLRYVSGPS